MSAVLVLLGGAIGAPARYLTDLYVRRWTGSDFPWGTMAVNAVGSFVLGLLAGAAAGGVLPAWVLTLAGTGFCGALTTFSTFSYETVRLAENGQWRSAALNVLVSLAVGTAAVSLGWVAGSAI
ncbi:fluoride efflux transporter CrcB [Nocardioides luteus]|uniref:fluoride efflux transporter CrcB n=1 Tax=Nocardioides luteus TaxID=1844 RepID=UPI0018CAB212|nr:fluoride efflux transporter CrcB [Nocardioides luteus]MBG6094467.1 CrcB protein [Nocardioides luteus]